MKALAQWEKGGYRMQGDRHRGLGDIEVLLERRSKRYQGCSFEIFFVSRSTKSDKEQPETSGLSKHGIVSYQKIDISYPPVLFHTYNCHFIP